MKWHFTPTRDIDIAILSVRPSSVRLSVRHVPVFYGNGLTYCHSFFTTRPNHLVLLEPNICEIPMGSTLSRALYTGVV